MAPLTPICAAPEQLSGGLVHHGDPDVYALGLLLFELLTGVHPWVGVRHSHPAGHARHIASLGARGEQRAVRQPTPMPRFPCPSSEEDLDAIVAKALRSEPSQRYSTVESLKLEIERMLSGEPVDARKGVPLYVVGRL